MPGDALSLAILVSGEEEGIRVSQQVLQLLDLLLLLTVDNIQRLEAVIDVDAEPSPGFLLVRGWNVRGIPRQIADVPDGRLDHILLPKEARDRARLRG